MRVRFYMGRDFTPLGDVVRYNYFHDLRSGALPGQEGFTEVIAVYLDDCFLDDCFSGVTVYGNLFVRAGRSAMIGGERDNTIENNFFIDNGQTFVFPRSFSTATHEGGERKVVSRTNRREVNHFA